MVIPGFLDEARSFSEGLAPVRVGKKWGFIDKKGNMTIQKVLAGLRIPGTQGK